MSISRPVSLLLNSILLTFLMFAVSGCLEEDPFGDESTLVACASDEKVCGSDEICVIAADGEPECRVPTCGNGTTVCARGYVCGDDQLCELPSTCSPVCEAGTHCISGNCIPDYTAANVCDPLTTCRELCGSGTTIDNSCLSACEADRSTTCSSCIDTLRSCEAREDCGNANAVDCCVEDYCSCFPDAYSCENPEALPCDYCFEEFACQDGESDQACIQRCISDNVSCSACLQPFAECRDNSSDPATECVDEYCDCTSLDAQCE